MTNPWIDYDYMAVDTVHTSDLETWRTANQRFGSRKGGSDFILSGSNVALPYFGNPEANLVLLYANPGLDRAATPAEETDDRKALFDLARRHELHEPHPFVFLNPEFEGTPGFAWWTKTLAPIVRRFSEDPAAVYSNIFSAEIHPYKSVKYAPIGEGDGGFPTSRYTYDLVERAVDRGALILIGRAQREWFQAVPKLRDYSKVIYLSSVQNSVISPNNVIYRGNPNLTEAEDQKNLAWQLITKVALRHPAGSQAMAEDLDEYLASWAGAR
jgi:hypothetical protein